MRIRKPSGEPQEPLSAPESTEPGYEPLFPRMRLRKAPTGLVVVERQLPEQERRQRRADNRRMKEIHSRVRKRKRHGRQ